MNMENSSHKFDLDDLNARINKLPLEQEFEVRTLMGDVWSLVPSKQGFGMKFKNAYKNKLLIGVEHVRLDNSPRRDIYKRVSI